VKDSFEDYVAQAEAVYRQHAAHGLRKGQAYYNALSEFKPNLAKSIVEENKIDPFYQDGLLPAFLQHVQREWNS
jgi:hypothetical protein